MHPLLADFRRLQAYLAAWLVVAAAIAALLHLTGRGGWAGAFLFSAPICLLYGFDALSAYWVCRTQPMVRRRVGSLLGVFGGTALLSGLAWLGVGVAWDALARLVFGRALVTLEPAGWILWFAGGTLMYLLSLLAHDVLLAVEQAQEAAAREAASRVLAREAELQVLRTQIDPHFLFNSLNSISALTTIDPAAAREMTVDLAQFFRRTLALADRERIALADEVSLCRHFLAIEQRRFGRKLRAELRIAPDAEPCLLPPMTLQPLLENAIKHGIRHLEEGGLITVDATRAAGALRLVVANPVPAEALPPARAGAHDRGVGLANLRERLAALYGARGRVEWRAAGGRFEIALELPAEEASAAAAPRPTDKETLR